MGLNNVDDSLSTIIIIVNIISGNSNEIISFGDILGLNFKACVIHNQPILVRIGNHFVSTENIGPN